MRQASKKQADKVIRITSRRENPDYFRKAGVHLETKPRKNKREEIDAALEEWATDEWESSYGG